MLSRIRNIFKKKPETQMLGRWSINNDVTKAIYANSDNCGDILCGNPREVKLIVNSQKQIKINLPQNNKLHTNSTINQINKPNEQFCGILLGMNGPCNDCPLHPKSFSSTSMEISQNYHK
jgi:hypothetical protein